MAKKEFKQAIFKSGQEGKFDRTLFNEANAVVFVYDEAEAKMLRKNAFFKRGIITELSEEDLIDFKASEAVKLGTVVLNTTQDDLDKKIAEGVARQLTILAAAEEPKKDPVVIKLPDVSPGEPGIAETFPQSPEDPAKALADAKAYLDKVGVAYHPATGIVKLQSKIDEYKENQA